MAARRLDVAVLDRGLAESRARAQALILGGGIVVDGQVITRPATLVEDDTAIGLAHEPLPYVSRGGVKLRHALDVFGVSVSGKTALDVGASTGGFTDVLLQAGARCVYAVDVGYGQLAWSLRNDERVVVMERTNIRYLDELPQSIDLSVVDVSFISLRQVLPSVRHLLTADGEVVCLIKPQFEAGKGQVGKRGVVRDPAVWRDVLSGVLSASTESGWTFAGLAQSPIRGPAGNVEFLAHLLVGAERRSLSIDEEIDRVLRG